MDKIERERERERERLRERAAAAAANTEEGDCSLIATDPGLCGLSFHLGWLILNWHCDC